MANTLVMPRYYIGSLYGAQQLQAQHYANAQNSYQGQNSAMYAAYLQSRMIENYHGPNIPQPAGPPVTLIPEFEWLRRRVDDICWKESA